MERVIDVKELTKFLFEATSQECDSLAQQFEFDKIAYVKGTFDIAPNKKILPCVAMEGEIQALVEFNGEEYDVKEEVTLYLVEKEDDMDKFEIYHDVEILKQGKLDIGSVIAQYVYLAVMSPLE